MASKVFFVLVWAASAAAISSNFGSGEGHLEPAKAAVIPAQQSRWTNGQVPYVLDASVANDRSLIQRAMMMITMNTCVRFLPRTYQKNYVKIFKGQGCNHTIGMGNGQQPLSLGEGCNFLGIVLHHLVGTLGFYNEHVRSDRDEYLEIKTENIRAGDEAEFRELQANQNLLLTSYDYNSIMQLGATAFSANGQPTMVAKGSSRTLRELYDNGGLSPNDVQGIRSAYNC